MACEFYVDFAHAINGLDLGSDHRAVQRCVILPPKVQRGKKRQRKVRVGWGLYKKKLMVNFSTHSINTLQDLGNEVKSIASECGRRDGETLMEPMASVLLQRLRARRRTCMDNTERSNIPKQVRRGTRSHLRKYRTTHTDERLQTFIEIKHLERLCMYPVTQNQKRRSTSTNMC